MVGATGLVGKTFLQVIQDRHWKLEELRLFASQLSAHKTLACFGRQWELQQLREDCFDNLDLVLFASSEEVSKLWAPKAVKAGAYVIDNSPYFRMQEALVVPEVNGSLLRELSRPCLIANPNCSAAQLVMVLKPLHDRFNLLSVKVATYQSVSGAGQAAIDELRSQQGDGNGKVSVFPHPIANNCIPQIGSLGRGGFFGEELKLIEETKKILSAPELKVSAMTVRVPVPFSHAEVVWLSFSKSPNHQEVLETLRNFPGLVIEDDPAKSHYPLQSIAAGRDDVFVGRVHQDLDDPNTYIMWIVSDNLRKGAATNAAQIAEMLF